MRRYAVALAIVLLVGGCLWYLSAPPKGPDGYRERAAATLETLRSQVETARIWSDAIAADRALGPTALVSFRQAESSASSATAQFDAYEPPQGLLELRAEVAGLGSEVGDAIGALRIAAELEEWEEVPPLARDLPPLSARLKALEERAEP